MPAFKDATNINLEIIRKGWGWLPDRREWIRDEASFAAQKAARSAGLGAWGLAGQQSPAAWRHQCWREAAMMGRQTADQGALFYEFRLEDRVVKGEGFAVDASIITADASRHHRITPEEADWSKPERQTRAVREYLSALEASAPDPARKMPEVLSPSDPAAAWTAKAHLQVQFAYGLNYLIDMDNAIIVDVEATPARVYDEVRSTRTMLSRTSRRLGIKPRRLAADTAYGTGALVGQRIAPHIPVWDKSQREDGTFSRQDFRFGKKGNVYFCPRGKILETTGHRHGGTTLLYRASKYDCTPCPLKTKCCPNTPERKIPRDVNEAARDRARSLAGTEAFQRSCNDRRKIEMRFAHLKMHHSFNRLRLRGLAGARDEFHLAAIAQNLKTLACRMA